MTLTYNRHTLWRTSGTWMNLSLKYWLFYPCFVLDAYSGQICRFKRLSAATTTSLSSRKLRELFAVICFWDPLNHLGTHSICLEFSGIMVKTKADPCY